MRVGSKAKQVTRLSATHPMKTKEKELSRSISAQSEAQPSIAPRAGFRRIPTYAVGRAQERRRYIRVRLAVPLRVQRIAGQKDMEERSLRTRDISSIGVYFFSPRLIEPGTPVELELLVVDQPFGRGSVRMLTEAHIVRVDDSEKPGWHGLAAAFDDISFHRDEILPERFQRD